ncbi:hypothetical protein CP533_2933 [Ophiocordyceps camponoti-saundersi (nom. inval.)]|nr:hypothetical protein CP533_2933 [Ophiocordyceps camponoti-saundersi (nom. inval.)]
MASPSQVTDCPSLTNTPPPEFSTTMPRFLFTSDIPRTIRSDNLIIRQFKNTDYDAYIGLLSAPSLQESHLHFPIDFTPFSLLVPSPYASDPHYFGVFLSTPDNEEGELIGSGGECTFCTSLPPISNPSLSNWPTLGFKFKREYMDRGYTTEFILTFLEFWWSLTRMEITMPTSLSQNLITQAGFLYSGGHSTEILSAISTNSAASTALGEAGFDYTGHLDNTREIWRNWRRDYGEWTSETDLDAFLSLFSTEASLAEDITNPHEEYLSPSERFETMLPDADEEDSRDYYNPSCYGIFIKTPDNREGQLIGFGGEASACSCLDLVPPYPISHWPSLLLKLKREYWNTGYVTEFLGTFMALWMDFVCD